MYAQCADHPGTQGATYTSLGPSYLPPLPDSNLKLTDLPCPPSSLLPPTQLQDPIALKGSEFGEPQALFARTIHHLPPSSSLVLALGKGGS